MFSLIERLRKKPRHERERMVGILTITLTLILFAAWIPLLQSRVARLHESGVSKEEGPITELSAVLSGYIEQGQEIQDSLNQSAETLDELETLIASSTTASSTASSTIETEPNL